MGKTNIEKQVMIVGSGEKIKLSRNEKENDENNERNITRKEETFYVGVVFSEERETEI